MRDTKRDFIANSRGFTCFLQMDDSYGREVRVTESSSAEGNYVWVFTEIPPASCTVEPADTAAAHLNAEQARELIDALNRWLAS